MARFVLRRADLDREITFQRKVPDDSFGGAGKESWVPVATVWAQVRDVLPSRAERVGEGLSIANRPARIRMDYRDDITPDMRIIHGARVMQIVAGPAELGRRDAMEWMAEDYSTAGDGA